MSGRDMPLEPKEVPTFQTKHRRIVTKIPVPESLDILNTLRKYESISMRGQALVLWDKAKDIYVSDRWGNQWIDWSSGVLITNIGHNHPSILESAVEYLHSNAPLAAYCFPHEPRANLVKKLVEISPPELDKAFLLTTGSEAIEVGIKLARTHGLRESPKKGYIISHKNAFHGRTLAAHLVGGALGGGDWVLGLDPNKYFTQVTYPTEPGQAPLGFDSFTRELDKLGVDPKNVAGVICETYPARNATLMPKQYAKDLRQWCYENHAVLILDEVQAGFGRTGKLFGYEHYDVIPDLVCCGKGISSSLPLSAVIGRAEYLDQYGVHEMTSTHTGSPLPVIEALSNIEVLLKDDRAIIKNAELVGRYLGEQLEKITAPFKDTIRIGGVGLVYVMQFFDEDGEPDSERANRFWEEAIYGGNMFFAPVGIGSATIKFCPPLTITKEAITDAFYDKEGIKHKLDKVMRE